MKVRIINPESTKVAGTFGINNERLKELKTNLWEYIKRHDTINGAIVDIVADCDSIEEVCAMLFIMGDAYSDIVTAQALEAKIGKAITMFEAEKGQDFKNN